MNLTKHKCWILSVFMPGSYFMTCMDLPCNTSLCWFRYQLPEGASFPCFFLPWKTKFLSTAKEHCCDFGWKNAKNQHYFMQCAEFQIFCLWDLLEISYSCGIVFWIISPFLYRPSSLSCSWYPLSPSGRIRCGKVILGWKRRERWGSPILLMEVPSVSDEWPQDSS